MLTKVIISLLFVLPCIWSVFCAEKYARTQPRIKLPKGQFLVEISATVSGIGAICTIVSTVVVLALTFTSRELPHIIFYLVFGFFSLCGVWMVVTTGTYGVIVADEQLTAFSVLKKPYTFSFNEINSVLRQTKNNRKKSERVVIETVHGKKVVAECGMICYERLLQKIKQEVPNGRLHNF